MSEPLIARIDHVSIAVRDYEKAEKFFRTILGGLPGAAAEDPVTKYFWQIFSLGDLSRLELVKPTAAGSFLDNFLAQREGGVHHVTMQTPDIEAAKTHLQRHGIPYFGYNEYATGWKEIFIHPRHAFGVLIQIAEFRPADYLAASVNLPEDRRWTVEKNGDGVSLRLAHPGGGQVQVELSKSEVAKLIADLETGKES